MSKMNHERTRKADYMRRYGSEANDGSSPVPRSPRAKREGPDAFLAIQKARYAVTDAGVRFAREAAAQGVEVVYASDWSPGARNEDELRAAGVEVVVCRPKRETP